MSILLQETGINKSCPIEVNRISSVLSLCLGDCTNALNSHSLLRSQYSLDLHGIAMEQFAPVKCKAFDDLRDSCVLEANPYLSKIAFDGIRKGLNEFVGSIMHRATLWLVARFREFFIYWTRWDQLHVALS